MKSSHQNPAKILTSEKMRKKHVFYVKENQKIFHMIALIVLGIASMLATLILVPFLLFFSASSVYVIVLISGLLFGMIFGYMILDLQHLNHRHHIISGIFVPIMAIINILLMMSLTKKVAAFFLIELKHDPLTVAMFYLIGFLLPYLFMGMVDYIRNKH